VHFVDDSSETIELIVLVTGYKIGVGVQAL